MARMFSPSTYDFLGVSRAVQYEGIVEARGEDRRRHQPATVDAQAFPGLDRPGGKHPALPDQGLLTGMLQVGGLHGPAVHLVVIERRTCRRIEVRIQVWLHGIDAEAVRDPVGPAQVGRRSDADGIERLIPEGIPGIDLRRIRETREGMPGLECVHGAVKGVDAAHDRIVVGLGPPQVHDGGLQFGDELVHVFVTLDQPGKVIGRTDPLLELVAERIGG
ncbi:hypothetical protein [Ralstonia solanacearum]|uniref:hypothetical protein n=1 Tax=Ralstonia solanacearum TaxID=305 RepID=UPI001E2B2142|nr:hypothetical protein [Ralstonia solanacearum]